MKHLSKINQLRHVLGQGDSKGIAKAIDYLESHKSQYPELYAKIASHPSSAMIDIYEYINPLIYSKRENKYDKPQSGIHSAKPYMIGRRLPEATEIIPSSIRPYTFKIFWPNKEPLNPECEMADLIVKTQAREYTGTLATPSFIMTMFEKNAKTGECAEGSFFCVPRLVIVKRLDRKTIKKTLDFLVDNSEFETYFK